MKINGKYNNSQATKHRLKQYSVSRRNPIFLKDKNMNKYQHSIHWKKFYQLHTETSTAVATT